MMESESNDPNEFFIRYPYIEVYLLLPTKKFWPLLIITVLIDCDQVEASP